MGIKKGPACLRYIMVLLINILQRDRIDWAGFAGCAVIRLPLVRSRTDSLKCLPALKRGTAIAGKLILALVAGLIPFRCGRCESKKLPKPVIETFNPFFNVRMIVRSAESSTATTSFLLSVVSRHISLMSSLLFIETP